MNMVEELPVVVIGAGPVGLAAAARLVERGIRPLVLERGFGAGAAVEGWGHVRVFSPWAYNVDAAARSLLEDGGWQAPDSQALPTGHELVRDYLAPLAAHPAIEPHVVIGATAEAVTRAGIDKVTSLGREAAPFVVRWRDRGGAERRVEARSVIDASGTWSAPNPMGVDGLAVEGERAAGDRISYGIPDVLGRDRAAYAGRRVLVVGGGHSAINIALDLLRLREDAPGTRITWALRRNRFDRLLGGGINDELPERGALGLAAKHAIEAGQLDMLAPFAAEHIAANGDGLRVTARVAGRPMTLLVDRIVVATGFRPELGMLRELRVALDPAVEAPLALAPLIDPNLHSCGTVPPHGAAELTHPEPGFYIVGAKSYGRAPTFLMATGYEQVRSVVAEIAGDQTAAREVRLVLPETGVCSAAPVAVSAGSGCCGGPAPAEVDACCVLDSEAKAAGKAGCGCGTAVPDLASA
jgi:thioredoxin reductase